MGKFLKIDPASDKAIFQQIVEAVQQKVLSGDLANGAFLPSVRDLAVELGVNPNTVAKAYQALQQSGAVESARGLGLKIVGVGDKTKELRRQKILEEKCDELIAASERLGFSWAETTRLLERLRKGKEKWKPKAL